MTVVLNNDVTPTSADVAPTSADVPVVLHNCAVGW